MCCGEVVVFLGFHQFIHEILRNRIRQDCVLYGNDGGAKLVEGGTVGDVVVFPEDFQSREQGSIDRIEDGVALPETVVLVVLHHVSHEVIDGSIAAEDTLSAESFHPFFGCRGFPLRLDHAEACVGVDHIKKWDGIPVGMVRDDDVAEAEQFCGGKNLAAPAFCFFGAFLYFRVDGRIEAGAQHIAGEPCLCRFHIGEQVVVVVNPCGGRHCPFKLIKRP